MLLSSKLFTSALIAQGICLSGCIVSALTFLTNPANAQVSVSPLVVENQAKRGQSQSTITVYNPSKSPSRVRIYTQPFTYSQNNGFQVLESSSNDLTPYLRFSPRELVIPPGVSRQVRLVTQLPPSIPQGEYRTAVFAETLIPQTDSNGNSVSLVARVAVTVYVRNGEVAEKLAVESASFNAEKNQIQLLVRNTGNASSRPKVIWNLQQGQNIVKTGQADTTTIVSGTDRYFLLNYPAKDQPNPTPGQYQLTGKLTWGGESNDKESLPFNVNINIPPKAEAPATPGKDGK